MANTRSMTRKQKKCNTSDDDGSKSWSNLNHDLLLLVMLHLGVCDFIAFSGACKSWRSLALSNWNKFMMSKQPMLLSISTRLNKKDCYLEDYTRRKLKTVIPHSNGRVCLGVTCGYLIFYGEKTHDFWLVNPFTHKELHFPGVYCFVSPYPTNIKGILVFSPSMGGWVFVLRTYKFSRGLCFSVAGKQANWRQVSTVSRIHDLTFSKGKIFTTHEGNYLCELCFNPEPTLIRMKNFLLPNFRKMKFVSSTLCVEFTGDVFQAIEVDYDEMKRVNVIRTIEGHAVFLGDFECSAATKPNTWAHPWARYEGVNYCVGRNKEGRYSTSNMWYFPHECLNDNDSRALMNILEE